MVEKTRDDENIENADFIKNLTIHEGSVKDLLIEGNRCIGIVTEDEKDGRRELRSNSVILTTGTFLGGRIHIGNESREAGRMIR